MKSRDADLDTVESEAASDGLLYLEGVVHIHVEAIQRIHRHVADRVGCAEGLEGYQPLFLRCL